MQDILRWTSIVVGLSMFAGTLLSLSRSPHWFVRGWDFPRVQIALLASGAGAVYTWCCSEGALHDTLFLGSVLACVLWQAARIYPYTPIAPARVQRSRQPSDERRLRLLISNVQMENPAHERLLRLVRDTDPDVLLAVETDERWVQALEPLAADYPHILRQPQSNWFGMILFSRLPLRDVRVEFLVQDDVPSVFAVLELAGERVLLCGLHPRRGLHGGRQSSPAEPVSGGGSECGFGDVVADPCRAVRAIGGEGALVSLAQGQDVPSGSEEDATVTASSNGSVTEERKRLAAEILPKHGRKFINYFGCLSIEQLA